MLSDNAQLAPDTDENVTRTKRMIMATEQIQQAVAVVGKLWVYDASRRRSSDAGRAQRGAYPHAEQSTPVDWVHVFFFSCLALDRQE